MSRWSIDVRDKPQMQLTTDDFGKGTMTATAPIVAGAVALDSAVRIELELALGSLKTGNFVLQTAARALIKSYRGDRLTFAAEGDPAATPWQVTGSARSGTLDIPMTVIATPAAEMRELHLGGSVSLNDVSIPLPGLTGTSSVTFVLDGRVRLTPA